jgi:membrane glycosyltransferase
MREQLDSIDVPSEATPSRDSLTTPAGLQATATLLRRRALVLTLNVATWAGMLGWAAAILVAGGWTFVDCVLLACFAVGLPWPVLGFWNAVIGLAKLHGRRNGLHEVAPFLDAANEPAPLTVSTAVLMTLRNEDPVRALLRLQTVKASLDKTGEGMRFSYFVLSDTDRADVVAAEEEAVTAWRKNDPERDRIVYRRRTENTGFKAGNVRDFCRRWGADFDLMLPLDADSLMTGDAIVRLVRIIQAYPKLGILQSLVVGTPSSSAFARLFQFGMRHGMRAYTMGQAWWVGDCGPYWGHNALVRIAPFAAHCALPLLPGSPPLGGHVLSHDQVEATLMRRAGFEVRVLPVEGGSYEDNPPDALAFIHRDVRWCQGNMQYLKLLRLPGLQPISRFQLLWAILMFIGIPAWTLIIALLPFAAWDAQMSADFPVASAKALYITFLLMYLAPKLAGLIDAVLTPGEVARFGGPMRFASSAALEVMFSFLQGAVTTIRTSLFMLGLVFGKSIVWSGQSRDATGVSWRAASQALWPQLVFGLIICSVLQAISPATLLWSLPLTAGYLLAIPFTVLTANPALGLAMRRGGIAAIPEDIKPPPEIGAIDPMSGR